jgi:hypothetical protein
VKGSDLTCIDFIVLYRARLDEGLQVATWIRVSGDALRGCSRWGHGKAGAIRLGSACRSMLASGLARGPAAALVSSMRVISSGSDIFRFNFSFLCTQVRHLTHWFASKHPVSLVYWYCRIAAGSCFRGQDVLINET